MDVACLPNNFLKQEFIWVPFCEGYMSLWMKSCENIERPLSHLNQYMATNNSKYIRVHPPPPPPPPPTHTHTHTHTTPSMWIPPPLESVLCYEASTNKTNSPLTSEIIGSEFSPTPTHPHLKWVPPPPIQFTHPNSTKRSSSSFSYISV